MSRKKPPGELILNPDGTIYHLNVRPGQVAETIILVGDPGRVGMVSRLFDQREHTSENREIVIHTGVLNGRRLTVMSTGMGPDNIDIVINELDALFSFDMEQRIPKAEKPSLNIVRLGTCGSLQPDIGVGTFIASSYGLGLDGILHFYRHAANVTDKKLTEYFMETTGWPGILPTPYIVRGSESLMDLLCKETEKGITATSMGFYGPQGRELRLPLAFSDLNQRLTEFRHDSGRIVNYEMETAALYGLAKMLGHQALTICLVLANRIDGTYLQDHTGRMEQLISTILDKLTS